MHARIPAAESPRGRHAAAGAPCPGSPQRGAGPSVWRAGARPDAPHEALERGEAPRASRRRGRLVWRQSSLRSWAPAPRGPSARAPRPIPRAASPRGPRGSPAPSLGRQPRAVHPPEPLVRARARRVLQPHVALPAQVLGEHAEEVRVVELLVLVGLRPVGDPGHLHVPHDALEPAELGGHVPVRTAHVVAIEEEPRCWPRGGEGGDGALGEGQGVEEVARHGLRADGLNEHLHAQRVQAVHRRAEALLIRHPMVLGGRVRDAGEAVHLAAVEGLGVVPGVSHGVRVLFVPPRQRRDAPLPRGPVARAHVKEDHLDACLLGRALHDRRAVVVELHGGDLHGGEARGGGALEAVQEGRLPVQHRQVGGELAPAQRERHRS
mmetsp:Transcript_3002/g.9866  ORF Transcript_3002/g.9866 Transcript_3002/m.9866 type:complete len:379 (-) Transcript_3002:29-1165(-)